MADRIIKDIEQIKTILTSALENGSIHALDRDVVSDKLRKLYDIVSSMPVATEYVTEKAAVGAENNHVDKEPVGDDAADIVEVVEVEDTASVEEEDKDVEVYDNSASSVVTHTITETVISPVKEVKEVEVEEVEAVAVPTEEESVSPAIDAEPVNTPEKMLEKELLNEGSLTARLGRQKMNVIAEQMCGGDLTKCLDLMKNLEQTGDFDKAVIYIQEHYPQKGDSGAVEMLVEVLTDKFI